MVSTPRQNRAQTKPTIDGYITGCPHPDKLLPGILSASYAEPVA
jgi:hypothetical protein